MLIDTDRAILEFILKMITATETIIKRHGSIDKAVEDIEGQNALLMCILQIGENLRKIKTEKLRKQLPIQESYGLRNLIAHHYDSVDISIISEIIEYDIPDLKNRVIKNLSYQADWDE